jgi:hypothetical protein
MVIFRKFFYENYSGKTAVIAYGRYNPPTIGHEKLINKLIDTANKNNADGFIVPTHTQDNKKNPLTYEEKVLLLQSMIGDNVNILSSGKTLMSMLHDLQAKGYTNIIHIAGSDRIPDFKTLIAAYNGKPDKTGNVPFEFKTYSFESAGDRDPDSENVEGMSASKLRQLAVEGDIKGFKQGMSNKLSDTLKEKAYKIIRERIK